MLWYHREMNMYQSRCKTAPKQTPIESNMENYNKHTTLEQPYINYSMCVVTGLYLKIFIFLQPNKIKPAVNRIVAVAYIDVLT